MNGTTSIENAQKERAEIDKRIEDFLKMQGKQLSVQNQFLVEQILIGQTRLGQQTEGVTALDNQRKIIERLFGSEIKRAQNLTGFMNEEFKLAKDQKGVRANQLKDLAAIVKVTEKQVALSKTEANLTEEQEASSQLGLKAQQALIGGYIKTRAAIKKINEELVKRIKLLTDKEVQLRLKEGIKILKQELKMRQSQLAFDKFQDTLAEKRQTRIRELADLEINRIRAITDAAHASFQTILDSPAGALFSAGEKREFQLKIATENYQRLVDDQQRLVDRQTVDTNRTVKAIDDEIKMLKIQDEVKKSIVKKETELAVARIDAQKATTTLQFTLMEERVKILQEEAKIFNTHLEGLAYILAADRVDREIAVETARQGGDAGAVRAELAERFKINGFDEFNVPDENLSAGELRKAIIESIVPKIQKNIEKLDVGKGLNKVKKAGDALNKTLESTKKSLDSTDQKEKIRLDNLVRDGKLTDARAEAQHKLKVAQLGQTQAVLDAKNALDELKKAAELAGNKWLKVAVTFVESFGQNALSSLNDLFTAMREGTLTIQNLKEGFQSFIISIVEDVQSTITEEFIVKPIKDFLAQQLRGFFGLGTPAASPQVQATNLVTAAVTAVDTSIGGVETEVRSSAEMICDCIRETMSPGPAMAGTDPGDKVVTEEGTWVQLDALVWRLEDSADNVEGLSEKLNFFGETAKSGADNISGAGDLISTAFASILNNSGDFSSNLGNIFQGAFKGILGIGQSILGSIGGAIFGSGSNSPGILSSIGGGIMDFFGFNSGGIVRHMAGGGQMRDRVPAMLEPGEFVIRKPMARSIGTPALNAMNSTGGMPNVEVVIKNEGTPQEATQAGTPRIDVDKMVVEIVTRDIRNNGPIRKTLRGEGTA